MDFLSPNKGDNQQSRVEDPLPFLLKIPQLFAQKGPISDLALFSTETDSLSLFAEIPAIVLANTFQYIFYWIDNEHEIISIGYFSLNKPFLDPN